MTEPLQSYLFAIRNKNATGVARAHAYWQPLEQLLRTLKPDLTVINDPVRIDCGAPDFILLTNTVPLGYIEAKDVGIALEDVTETGQLKQYRHSLHNLILTNYLDFFWYVDGKLCEEASLGSVHGQEIREDREGRDAVRDLLTRFFRQEATPIVTAEELAQRMTQLARLMDIAIKAMVEVEQGSRLVYAHYRAFQDALIPNLSPAEFASIYAQTLTYGLFSARVQKLDGRDKLPIYKYLSFTNPFLCNFFYQISEPNMPDAVSWVVNDLAHVLRRADMEKILHQSSNWAWQEDLIIHFYETFLRKYDPKLRLMTHPSLDQLVTRFPQNGSNEVAKGYPRYVEPTPMGHSGRIYINKTQFFEGIDPDVWAFQIGDHQPVDKWLKDRHGRVLSFEDIRHYQRILVALQQTQRLRTTISGFSLDATTEGNPNRGVAPYDADPHLNSGNENSTLQNFQPSERDTNPPQLDDLETGDGSVKQDPVLPNVDAPLDKLELFSTRTRNALMRRGIITLRLLMMHTLELVHENTTNIGDRGIKEIETTLAQWNWFLPKTANPKKVLLSRLITSAFHSAPAPIDLPSLTNKVNFFDRNKKTVQWDQKTVAAGASGHPYIETLSNGLYRFISLPPIYTIPFTPPQERVDNNGGDLDTLLRYTRWDLIENQEGFSGNTDLLDEPFTQLQIFPPRVERSLMKWGVVSPRLLLMHTRDLLVRGVKNLGSKGVDIIESAIVKFGWKLAEEIDEEHTTLLRLITTSFYNQRISLSITMLTGLVNYNSLKHIWDEEEVAKGAIDHPYIVRTPEGLYRLIVGKGVLSPKTSTQLLEQQTVPTESETELVSERSQILLNKLWAGWLETLRARELEVLFLRYGVNGEEPLTLREVGESFSEKLTRERARQLEKRGIEKLGSPKHKQFWKPLKNLLEKSIKNADGFITQNEWEKAFDKEVVWDEEGSRPKLLQLLTALFGDYHYLPKFQVATFAHIRVGHFHQLDGLLKQILQDHKKSGLSPSEIIEELHQHKSNTLPIDMRNPAFIFKAINLFERVGLGENGNYIYLKEKKVIQPTANLGWPGKEGSRLYEWEMKLRRMLDGISWIGQLPFTETEFHELCQIIQAEAQEKQDSSQKIEWQPRLVPPVVFIVTMVFAARYSEQDVDEFWAPYLRTVWNVDYSQAAALRCRKRFIIVVPWIETIYQIDFPRQSEGDIVSSVYRHALLPKYVQSDFAAWLRSKWKDILFVADSPQLLISDLRQDKSLRYLSRQLQKFIHEKSTRETAAALVTNMAAAISLYVNDGESIESINDLLADSPIEQEVWRELAQVFLDAQQKQPGSLRQSKPRLTWVWALDTEEIALRVQNVILPADNGLEGEPDRLAWLNTPDDDPLTADIEIEVNPWRMQTGERIIQDAFFEEPDGVSDGALVLLTDMDEEALRLELPPQPAGTLQFYRATQQGAFGIPVQPAQVGEGMYFVCAKRPLIFLDEDNEAIEPDEMLPVPYPLEDRFAWAAQITLTLPVTVKQGAKKIMTLAESSSGLAVGRPTLTGFNPIANLSRQVQPTFTSTDVTLSIDSGGERLLKRASLWMQGKDGWRLQRPLSDLHQQGKAALNDGALHIQLQSLLPSHPNFYTVELRTSLQPVFSAPLQFAVVPGLQLTPPPTDQLMTPANLPQLELSGIDESAVVRREGLDVELLGSGRQQITWTDLRYEPRITLRFDRVDIPLAWSIPRFMAWLEPKPKRPFLTFAELRNTTLHAVGTRNAVSHFSLFIPGQPGRSLRLQRGRYSVEIGQSQYYDMVKLASEQHVIIKAQTGAYTWPLFEVRRRPNLHHARAEYDAQDKMVLFSSGLREEWVGNGRFIVESVTNPFAPPVELGRVQALKDLHLLSAALDDGVYLLRLELDGAFIDLNETAMRFTVGTPAEDLDQAQQLIHEIRGGQIISNHQLAEDFVVLWAENAEAGQAELIPTTLFQLATVPAALFDNFLSHHLQKLWSPLVQLQATQNQTKWIEENRPLPAWIFFSVPLTIKLAKHGYQLRVYPILTMQKGRNGQGFAMLRLSPEADSPKIPTFIQWQPASGNYVQVEAGIPATDPEGNWADVDLLGTYALHICTRCGRLVGTDAVSLPKSIYLAHRHGQEKADLRNITIPGEKGFQLLAEIFPERRGQPLLDVYEELGVDTPLPEAYFPEPAEPVMNLMTETTHRGQLISLIREIKRLGQDGSRFPLWTSAARLLSAWHFQNSVSLLGQAAFALSVLLRTAAYRRHSFHTMLKDANLSKADCQNLLAVFNQTASDHLTWGLTWAELLYLHSPDQIN